ncbi:hypothetical protein P7C71_g4898, partial [Lecanoromycetidae sp. Uapishka_2]
MSAVATFDDLPSGLSNKVIPFKIAIKDDALEELYTLLSLSKLAPVTYEGLQDRKYGSFLEFLPILSLLKEKYDPDTLSYHIIAPSLPGYAFSSPPPLDRNFEIQDIARLLNRLMVSLGFEKEYAVQGGDIGSKVSRVIAATQESCKVNFCIMPKPDNPVGEPDDYEEKGLERAAQFKKLESAYALFHAMKPATIGYVLAANPLSLLAW